jgi:hypothetical protein
MEAIHAPCNNIGISQQCRPLNSACLDVLQCDPVEPPPAELAADRAQREHAEQAVERAQLSLFEFD